MSYYTPPAANPYYPQQLGFTSSGTGMSFNYKALPMWVPASGGQVPASAVGGGQDGGEAHFVARAHHQNLLMIGKLHPSHRTCYVSYGGKEHSKPNYEVLVNPGNLELMWVPAQGKNLPPGVIQGGIGNGREPLFVGRVNHNGCYCIGKVNAKLGQCFIPYAGREIGNGNYEVLVIKSLSFA